MSFHNDLGRLGEEAAAFYLMERDYHILERNWRLHPLEIDLIAEEFGEIVFVEVKTRRDDRLSDPEAAVDRHKQERISQAALAYLHRKRLTRSPFRFDIITLVGTSAPFNIEHFKNAFPLRRPHGHPAHGLEHLFL